jgi:hypothetical protein
MSAPHIPQSLEDLERPSPEAVRAAILEGERMIEERLRELRIKLPLWDEHADHCRCTI